MPKFLINAAGTKDVKGFSGFVNAESNRDAYNKARLLLGWEIGHINVRFISNEQTEEHGDLITQGESSNEQ